MLALIFAGCGGGSSASVPADAGVNPPGPTLVRIEVTPANAQLPAGFTEQLVAIGVYSDSTTQDVTSQATWRSGRDATATVSADGVVTGVAVGNVAITARIDTVTASVPVTVTDAELVAIAVTQLSPTLPKGQMQQLTASGSFTDRSTRDLTRDVTWTSSASQFVLVSNQPGSRGLATAVAIGTAKITATMAGKSGEATVQATGEVLVSINLGPPTSLPNGLSQRFQADAVFSDQSTLDVTRDVLWMSSAPEIAQISNADGSEGKVTAAAVGTANITATLQGKTGTVALEVTDAELQHLDLAPKLDFAPKGVVRQFTATGTFSDQSMRDMTEEVLWESSATAIASISNAPGSRGKAKAEIPGDAVITASMGQFLVAQTTLHVVAAAMVAIELNPGDLSVPRGGLTQQFTATAIFTDGLTTDVSGLAEWTSSKPVVAQVSNVSPFQGKTTTGQPGTTIIRATIGALSGIANLTVTPATLVSVAMMPPELQCPRNVGAQLRAVGTFSDQTTRDVTEDMTWESSDFLVARVLNTEGQRGQATCVAGGDATISATRGEVRGECAVHVSQNQSTAAHRRDAAGDELQRQR